MCELHSHTRWSDGHLSTREIVELYAGHGFDVLCITDHVVRDGSMVTERNFRDYLNDVRREARRAKELYDLLVIPGLELTWDESDCDDSAHAVAIGLDAHIALDDGFEAALQTARDRGAVVVAVHPHGIETDANQLRITRRWWLDHRLRSLAHRFELVNRLQVFAWVAAEGLPSVASGDVHVPEHVATWKTLVPADRSAADVIDCLRSTESTPITRFAPDVAAPESPSSRLRAMATAGATAELRPTG
jgi:3',5'-nucleoside bisphosphate phosphatase